MSAMPDRDPLSASTTSSKELVTDGIVASSEARQRRLEAQKNLTYSDLRRAFESRFDIIDRIDTALSAWESTRKEIPE